MPGKSLGGDVRSQVGDINIRQYAHIPYVQAIKMMLCINFIAMKAKGFHISRFGANLLLLGFLALLMMYLLIAG